MERPERRKTLEEQFDSKKTVELYGGQIEIIDVSPENLKTEIPVVVLPGWAAEAADFKENIIGIAGDGRRVLSVNAPYGINHDLPEQSRDVLPDAELRKVAALINAMEMAGGDSEGIDVADVVAHSEAGLFSVVAAYLYPGRFRNMVLVSPAGLMGEDNFSRLNVGFSAEVVRQTLEDIRSKRINNQLFKTLGDVFGHMAKKPMKSLREVLALSNTQTEDILRELVRRGIGISVIGASRDMVFPSVKIRKIIDKIDGVDFYEIEGRHNDVYLKPEEYNPSIIKALDKMERGK